MIDVIKHEKDVYNDLNKREREANKGTGFDSMQSYKSHDTHIMKKKGTEDYPHGNQEHTADDLDNSAMEDSMSSRSRQDKSKTGHRDI